MEHKRACFTRKLSSLVRVWKHPNSHVSRAGLCNQQPSTAVGTPMLVAWSCCRDENRQINNSVRLSKSRDFADGLATWRGGDRKQTTQAIRSRRMMERRAAHQIATVLLHFGVRRVFPSAAGIELLALFALCPYLSMLLAHLQNYVNMTLRPRSENIADVSSLIYPLGFFPTCLHSDFTSSPALSSAAMRVDEVWPTEE